MRARPVQHESLRARILDRVSDFSAASPARFAVLVFGSLIGIFTILFSLPISTTSGERAPFVDSLFTAVSVICVSGL
jgi:trk system potassium uptake protein TrkH